MCTYMCVWVCLCVCVHCVWCAVCVCVCVWLCECVSHRSCIALSTGFYPVERAKGGESHSVTRGGRANTRPHSRTTQSNQSYWKDWRKLRDSSTRKLRHHGMDPAEPLSRTAQTGDRKNDTHSANHAAHVKPLRLGRIRNLPQTPQRVRGNSSKLVTTLSLNLHTVGLHFISSITWIVDYNSIYSTFLTVSPG